MRQISETDPEAAKGMLEQIGKDLQEAVQELRNLAHGIYPPLLMDRGLPEALSAAAGRAALPTDVEAEGIGRYPQPIEAAVYFCVLEALQNAAKHAGEGSEATSACGRKKARCSSTCVDDGAGFDMATGAHHGHGFVNMSDRVGAIGGTIAVESSPGHGTTIRGRIPLTDCPRSDRGTPFAVVSRRGPGGQPRGHHRDERGDEDHRCADQPSDPSTTLGTGGMPCQSAKRATLRDRAATPTGRPITERERRERHRLHADRAGNVAPEEPERLEDREVVAPAPDRGEQRVDEHRAGHDPEDRGHRRWGGRRPGRSWPGRGAAQPTSPASARSPGERVDRLAPIARVGRTSPARCCAAPATQAVDRAEGEVCAAPELADVADVGEHRVADRRGTAGLVADADADPSADRRVGGAQGLGAEHDLVAARGARPASSAGAPVPSSARTAKASACTPLTAISVIVPVA